MLITKPLPKADPGRDLITDAYRMDESNCINRLIEAATLPQSDLNQIINTANTLVINTRQVKKKQSKIDALLHQYDLSTEEGVALMCLAEALLRIPDKATVDKFISDKISTASWTNHLKSGNSFFVNAATWSLLLSGKIYAPTLETQDSLFGSLKKVTARLGIAVIRPIIMQMMKIIGKQFVMGQTIEEAIQRAAAQEAMGYRYSYDMLGEAARTEADAAHYFQAYVHAIEALGVAAKQPSPIENPGISIKLSALHPRYEFAKRDRVMQELPPKLLQLAQMAKQHNIGLTVDAEEADRLDLSLDIFTEIFAHQSLANWEGFGLAVQAYQKRAFYVIDWLQTLSAQYGKRIMVRLVKGAYWDAEIKYSQLQGYANYPVFTRKNATDVSYLACAKKLLDARKYFYPQFGTHNAYSVAAIMQMAGKDPSYEFQCLHGMGRPLYDQIVDRAQFNRACRIYAPVGTHQDLLGYLVRRLLENGANSSFVNRLADEAIPVEQIAFDPVARIKNLAQKPHPRIPLPKDIYGAWQNSAGIDLSNAKSLALLKSAMEQADEPLKAASIIQGDACIRKGAETLYAPANLQRVIGYVNKADEADVEKALHIAYSDRSWGETPVTIRAQILEKIADALQQEMPALLTLLTREGGKCIPDGIAEVREAIDFCRYYALRAKEDLAPQPLPGPTGEYNELRYYPRGVIACISPWNFPLAIFIGQIIAALAAGNNVIAKPAEQTPLVAYRAVQIMLQAGLPAAALQLLIGKGSVVGAKIVADPRVAGVMFTGSTETAQHINLSLAKRPGPIGMLVAETGGQNAMIVDSSALAEQSIMDIAHSAFNSAGQRCSALRVLYVQEEMAPKLLTMLAGYMQEMNIGDPAYLMNDIGPVIDADARDMLMAHYHKMQQSAQLVASVPLPEGLDGHYFAPCAFEIPHISVLEGEVFGPILHIIRYQADKLDQVIDDIISTGYGLTFGIHSRIDATIQQVISRVPAGNLYVNRNMIGAVVGVQPFGGQGLSGTGPKAGGPHYVAHLAVERAVSINTTAVGGNAKLVSLLEED